ncbi:MAG: serine hydrolase [Gammaproteobacteria bacterium]
MFRVITFLVSALLVSCGGGGSGSDNSVNVIPPITSAPTTGCSVGFEAGPFTKVWPGLSWETATPESQGMCPDNINEAMDYAFQDGNFTGAVIVIRNGYIVAERYADDRMATDLVTSWSVAKSFTSALIGKALDEGLISSLDQQVSEFIPAWKDSDKEVITLRQLMTVKTALELLDGGDFYGEEDQLQVSIDRNLIGQPGEQLYTYSNSDVMLAGEVVRSSTSMTPKTYLDQKIGSVIRFSGEWWQDTKGHVLTYCCLDSTARDFGRFGLLFARNGEWEGQEILSDNWITESTAPALSGQYGFYWWPAPNTGFTALGVQGQIVAVYPAEDLVIMRFSSYTRMGDGSVVRTGDNYHATTEPANFENNTFIDNVLEALE